GGPRVVAGPGTLRSGLLHGYLNSLPPDVRAQVVLDVSSAVGEPPALAEMLADTFGIRIESPTTDPAEHPVRQAAWQQRKVELVDTYRDRLRAAYLIDERRPDFAADFAEMLRQVPDRDRSSSAPGAAPLHPAMADGSLRQDFIRRAEQLYQAVWQQVQTPDVGGPSWTRAAEAWREGYRDLRDGIVRGLRIEVLAHQKIQPSTVDT